MRGKKNGTFAQYARSRKISRASISRAYKQGVFNGALVERPGRKYPLLDFKKADALRVQRQLPDTRVKTGDKSGFVEARSWSERYRAANIKLALEIKRGLLIRKREVHDKAFTAGRQARDALFNIPDRVAAILAAESDESRVKEIMQAEIEVVVNDYIKALTAITK